MVEVASRAAERLDHRFNEAPGISLRHVARCSWLSLYERPLIAYVKCSKAYLSFLLALSVLGVGSILLYGITDVALFEVSRYVIEICIRCQSRSDRESKDDILRIITDGRLWTR